MDNNNPGDITSRNLLRSIDKIKNILINYDLQTQLLYYQKLKSHFDNELFTISIVGLPSRGKSVITNKIIRRELLAIEPLSSHKPINIIQFSNKESVQLYSQDGISSEFNLDKLKNTSADDLNKSQASVLLYGISEDWLNESRIRLIDHSGIGKIVEDENVFRLYSISDATLLVISATMAFGLVEKQLLTMMVQERVPKIAIIISRMDSVREQEREQLLDFVLSVANNWNYRIPVFVADEASALNISKHKEICGVNQIRTQLMDWTADDAHFRLKLDNIRFRTLALINEAYQILDEQLTSAVSKNEQKHNNLNLIKDKILRKKLVWEDLRLAMEQRANQCYLWLEKSLQSKRDNLSDKLHYELSKASNPKNWWERDLPFVLNGIFSSYISSIEKQLDGRLSEDCEWLRGKAKRYFERGLEEVTVGNTLSGNSPGSESSKEAAKGQTIPVIPAAKIKDINKIKKWARVGSATATIAGYFFFGPLGIAFSVAGGLASEKILDNNIVQQRSELERRIDRMLDNAIRKILSDVLPRVTECYQLFYEGIKQEEEAWVLKELGIVESQLSEIDPTISHLRASLVELGETREELILMDI